MFAPLLSHCARIIYPDIDIFISIYEPISNSMNLNDSISELASLGLTTVKLNESNDINEIGNLMENRVFNGLNKTFRISKLIINMDSYC
jgi:CO dehydrogenase nickel-insertion accessory protein CooC1